MFISSETDLCGRVTCNRQWRSFLLRSLTETLHGIEREGLIERNLRPVAPPQAGVPLDRDGRNVLIPLQDLCHRAKAHIPQRQAGRNRYDSLKLGQIPDRAIGKFDSRAHGTVSGRLGLK